MFRKPELHKKVIELRRKGFSYGEILAEVRVPRSTLSEWCHEIELTHEQKIRIQNKRPNNRSHERAELKKILARNWAEKQIGKLTKNKELLILSSILLYWAEGTKLNEESGRQEVSFTNTDKRMIEIIMKFFREILDVPEEKINIRVRIGSLGNVHAARIFWSKVTKIPLEKLKKTELLILSEKSRSLEKYPNGICRISVYDILIARKIAAFIEKFCKLMLP